MKWASGITTCGRPGGVSYLEQTIQSCLAAGWEQPLVQEDAEHAGAWPTWLACLRSLIEMEPDADAVLLLQDDVLLAKGAREYVERSVLCWGSGWQLLNLYTSGITAQYLADTRSEPMWKGRRWYQLPGSWLPRRFAGACALVLPMRVAKAVSAWGRGAEQSVHHADRRIAEFCQEYWVPPYVHLPSLAQHVGDVSAVFTEHNGSPALCGPMRTAAEWCSDVTELS